MLGPDRADLGDRHLEVGQEFEQIGLERLVGAVQFVDQQHRRAVDLRLQRLQQRPLDQEAVGEDRALDLAAILLGRLGEADLDHLARVIPLVDGRGDVEPLVALQADQPAPERRRQHLGDLGLADPGLAFEEQRALQVQREMHRGGERTVRDIVGAAEQAQRVADGGGQGGHRGRHIHGKFRQRRARSARDGATRAQTPGERPKPRRRASEI